MQTIRLDALLRDHGFAAQVHAKMVRHQDSRFDMDALINAGQFEIYQSYQARPIFDCKSVVSFVGDGGTRARLVGVYTVGKRLNPGQAPALPVDFLFSESMNASTDYFYELERDERFAQLENRVVIEWGLGTRSWCQNYRDREILEILPRGYVRRFPGYLDFVISYKELVEIVRHPAANREWHRSLSAVSGVYLITDTTNGDQYVGSAYGRDGILGRWSSYSKRADGGNSLLKKLLQANPGREQFFNFTILRPLDKTLSRKEVFAIETIYKKKLGSRAHGLNAN
jgi:hypothetical protein